MIKVDWKLNGRSVPPGQLGREFAKSIQNTVLDQTKAAIAKVRCPVHGSTPHNIRISSGSGDRFNFQYESCCDRLQQAVNSSFK